jgi:hypothetical protein
MLNVIMLNVIMLNVIMLNVIVLNVIVLNFVMLNVVILNVIRLNVVAPPTNVAFEYLILKSSQVSCDDDFIVSFLCQNSACCLCPFFKCMKHSKFILKRAF